MVSISLCQQIRVGVTTVWKVHRGTADLGVKAQDLFLWKPMQHLLRQSAVL